MKFFLLAIAYLTSLGVFTNTNIFLRAMCLVGTIGWCLMSYDIKRTE